MAAWGHQVVGAGHDRHLEGEIEREQRPHEHPRPVVIHRDWVAPQRAPEQTEAVHFMQGARCKQITRYSGRPRQRQQRIGSVVERGEPPPTDVDGWTTLGGDDLEERLREVQRAASPHVTAAAESLYATARAAADAQFDLHMQNFSWDSTPHDRVTRVRLQGVGHVRAHRHRPVVGRVKTVSVKREGKRWYVILTAEQEQSEPLPRTGSVAGIDMGIANFLADSNGEFVPSPRHGRRAAAKLEAAQQALARFPRVRRDKRTANHRRAVQKVAGLHRTVRRQRLDHAHKTALGLVREHDVIAHEDLKIRNMVKAPEPKPDPEQPGRFLPNGAAAKAGLNHSISDAGWGVFLKILHAKAESAGREVIVVDPRNTSRTCPQCGHVSAENRLTQEKFHCVSCGHSAHADTVGALNVLRAGLARRNANPA
ncbi:RNA-guided endonuclease InsQ/TnpB family protein [Streptomyces phaeochromogenes]|uniref:RNA-guided endonuclease InsQ/TnpB family protein n=1 Tax=Streptomyces phaeochromogenes TaxID=1923 RepID=UPI0027D83930|nr:transposase [Streptomyces phaeochromogenes]